jgi:glucose-1-phosphate adenylyltransferase
MQLTDWRAKPAVPVGGKFRILDFTLSNCVNSGIRRIGVATQYKAQSLIQHLQRGWSFLDGRFDEFIDLLPAQQQIGEDWYQGTADAVFQNLDVLRRNGQKYVLILSGDHIYKAMPHAGTTCTNADLTIACMMCRRRRLGVMGIDADSRITSFVESRAACLHPRRPDRAGQHGCVCFQCRLPV